MFRALTGFVLLCLAASIQAMPALVDSQWVEANAADPALVVLDIQSPANFRRFHLPRSVNAPYELWRTSKPEESAGMMPPVDLLESMLGQLGITNESKILIVPTGLSAGEMAAAARVYWTLKVLGHAEVGILNGGLAAYAERFGVKQLKPGHWQPEPSVYEARPDEALMLDAGKVQQALGSGADFVDARSSGEYVGLHVGGAEERPGTIPGARNLPFDWLTENASGEILSAERMGRLFDIVGIEKSGEQIHFCHTGNRAALNWFVAYGLLGNKDAKLYDGSMAEWATRQDLPLELKISL